MSKSATSPFSVYMKFLAPENLKGQEVIYVEGANDGNLIGHAGSGLMALAGAEMARSQRPAGHDGPALSDYRIGHRQFGAAADRSRRAR